MKRTIKLIISVTLVMSLVISLAGCGTKKMENHIEIVSKGFQHEFWQAVKKGAEDAAADNDWTINFVGPATESDVSDQVDMLADAVNKNPEAIAFAALDTQAALDELNKAKEADIPMVAFDSGVPNAPAGMILATIATDNKAAGALAAEELYAGIKADTSTGAQLATMAQLEGATADNKFRVGIVAQDQISDSLYQRTLGFVEKMVALAEADGYVVAVVGNGSKDGISPSGDEASAVFLVDVQVSVDTTLAECTATAESVFQKSDLNAVFTPNQGGVDGIIAVADAHAENWLKDTYKVCGFDAGSAQKAQIASGNFYGSITQDPYRMGYETVVACINAAEGKTVSDLPLDGVWYNASNMDDPMIAILLYD
ncbi:MAG: substrate-binding domain-containing protein [Vallitaleaceae bacterium]|jgi:ribose transport system substrate-binding protein|nr:substrate-binding domain-containing protein [Vallitaleaceae bacterium]